MNLAEKIMKMDLMKLTHEYEVEIYKTREKIWELEEKVEKTRVEKTKNVSEKIIKDMKISCLKDYLMMFDDFPGALVYNELKYDYDGEMRFNFNGKTKIPEHTEVLFEVFDDNEGLMEGSLDYTFYETAKESCTDGWVEVVDRWNSRGVALNKLFEDYMSFEEFEKNIITDKEFKEEVKVIASIHNLKFVKRYLDKIEEPGNYQKELILKAVLETAKKELSAS